MTQNVTIHDSPLPYEPRLDQRMSESIDLIVIHSTELPDLATARIYGERLLYAESQTGNSGHYYIDRDGSIHRFVSDTRIAHHVRGYNARSIGIELVNSGRYPNWLDSRHQTISEPYPATQISALLALLKWLKRNYTTLAHIAGHEDLDRGLAPASDNPQIKLPRKRDPGPLFPWASIVPAAGLQRLLPAL